MNAKKKSVVSFNSIIPLVQFLVLIIVPRDRYYHWGTQGEAMETLCYYFFATSMCVCNYLKVKSFQKCPQ